MDNRRQTTLLVEPVTRATLPERSKRGSGCGVIMILTLSCRDADQFNRRRVIGEVGKRDCVVLDFLVLTNEYSQEPVGPIVFVTRNV